MRNRRSLPPYEDELSLALLRSAERDGPSMAAYHKAAAALGVGAAVGLSAAFPAPAALASAGLSASAGLRWSGSLLGKVLAIGTSGLVAGLSGVALLRAHHEPVASAVASTTARLDHPLPVASAQRRVVSLAASPTAVPAPSPSALAEAPLGAAPVSKLADQPSPHVKAVGGHVKAAARSVLRSSLPEQVSSLDRARVALNSGYPSSALAEIARYRSTWPNGVFLTEASVLEIEALAKNGETSLAAARAQAFVTAHPDSPQADRLRTLIPSGAR